MGGSSLKGQYRNKATGETYNYISLASVIDLLFDRYTDQQTAVVVLLNASGGFIAVTKRVFMAEYERIPEAPDVRSDVAKAARGKAGTSPKSAHNARLDVMHANGGKHARAGLPRNCPYSRSDCIRVWLQGYDEAKRSMPNGHIEESPPGP